MLSDQHPRRYHQGALTSRIFGFPQSTQTEISDSSSVYSMSFWCAGNLQSRLRLRSMRKTPLKKLSQKTPLKKTRAKKNLTGKKPFPKKLPKKLGLKTRAQKNLSGKTLSPKNSQKILNQKTCTKKNSPKKPTSRKMKVDLRLLFSLIQNLRNIVLKMRFEIQKLEAEISGLDMF